MGNKLRTATFAALALLFFIPTPAPATTSAVTLASVQYGGVVRFTGTPPTWTIIDDTGHTPEGLLTVSCSAVDGELSVTYPTLTEIVTSAITADDTYAGRYAAGGSVGYSVVEIVFRNMSGTFTPCYSNNLNIAGSNVFIYIWGKVEA